MNQQVSNAKQIDENIDIIHNWEPLEFEMNKEFHNCNQHPFLLYLSFYLFLFTI